MIRVVGAILVVLACLGPAWAQTQADRARPRGDRPRAEQPAASASAPLGSAARQLHLKQRLAAARGGDDSLADTIRRNRKEWDRLTPQQRDQYRRTALAFLEQDPQEQERLVKRYEALSQMSPQQQQEYQHRARWLKVVMASFTADEQRQLRQAPPAERARRLLERKEELIEQGVLTAEGYPVNQPAALPAEEPAVSPVEDDADLNESPADQVAPANDDPTAAP